MANPDRRPLRVIQWSTGNAGKNAVRGIVRHPDLELVGLHAHAKEKQGVDAAELCGLAKPTGVRATSDVDALLAIDADCVCYMAQGETRIRETIDDLTRILRSGKNVVNTSLVSLCYPAFSPKLRDALQKACEEGGTTFFTSGFDPGWSGDVIPLALASTCERVDSIRVTECMDYSTYEDPGFTGVFFGYGRPLDYDAPLLKARHAEGRMGLHGADARRRARRLARRDPRGARASAGARDVRDAHGQDREGHLRGRALRGAGDGRRQAGARRGARESPAPGHRPAVGPALR
jgi:hypothetical protein